MQTAKRFDLYTAEGSLIFRLYLTEEEYPPPKAPAHQEPQQERRSEEPTPPPTGSPKDGNGNGEPMTSPQRRKLFRVLAMRGIEGEKAHDELKKLFHVDSLNIVGKTEASRMIDHLIREEKGGNGHGPSL